MTKLYKGCLCEYFNYSIVLLIQKAWSLIDIAWRVIEIAWSVIEIASE